MHTKQKQIQVRTAGMVFGLPGFRNISTLTTIERLETSLWASEKVDPFSLLGQHARRTHTLIIWNEWNDYYLETQQRHAALSVGSAWVKQSSGRVTGDNHWHKNPQNKPKYLWLKIHVNELGPTSRVAKFPVYSVTLDWIIRNLSRTFHWVCGWGAA